MKFKDKNEDIEYNENTIPNYQEDDEERKGPPFILLFLFTTVSVLFALGLSFSTIKIIQNNETINSLISKITNDNEERYVITYSESTGNEGKNGIYLVNQFPTPDEVGKKFNGSNYVYNFSLIIGDKTAGAYYEFTAIPTVTTNALNASYVKIYLQKNGEDVPESYKANNKVKVYTDYSPSKYEEAEGVVIYSGVITEDEAKKGRIDFVMRMWISEDAQVNEDFNNKSFGVKVNTYAAFTKGE